MLSLFGQRSGAPLAKSCILLILFLQILFCPLIGAEPYEIRAPFERNENGHIILRLEIGSGTTRLQTRWQLDTGAVRVFVSDKVPAEYYSLSQDVVAIRDVNAKRIQGLTGAVLKELYLGGHKFEKVDAVIINFNSMSKYEDEPIDGIIGMNLLKNHCIKLDFINNLIIISNQQFRFEGIRLPIEIGKVPTCQLRNGKQIVYAICDTGSNGSINLPPLQGSKPRPGGGSYNAGLFSNAIGSSTEPESLEWRGRHWFSKGGRWTKPSVGVTPGLARGTIGLRVWAATPSIVFDFIRGWIIFPDQGPELPLDASDGPLIPVAWDRTNPLAHFLVVEGLSYLESQDRLGFQSDDIVLSIDGKPDGLSRRRFQEALKVPGSIFEVKRGGQVMRIVIPHGSRAPSAKG